ncbi:energy transducer TonB [Alteromonas sp. 009811495]|uniref:energy transducer TonB n=1 Tax=Alteromonas sp. 009811495 TaxID=3002962 RepID=UPI00237E18A8|nr:energy transducer TonB [Alteromonas sp. 009811495]WDT85744.1 energy transducer TonB [Alteromonas sp. 009811495]
MVTRTSSFLLSGLVLAFALGTMWLGQLLAESSDTTVIVRNVDMLVTTPPPPPPVSQSSQTAPTLDIQVKGAGAQLMVSEIVVSPTLDIYMPTMPEIDTTFLQWSLSDIDTSAFALNELDSTPTLLTPIKVHFPKRLKKQGVSKVLVKLDVLIDEQGHVELVDIVENPHHELNKEIVRFVKNSRFTSPSKEDAAVKARFIWPVLIEA